MGGPTSLKLRSAYKLGRYGDRQTLSLHVGLGGLRSCVQ